MMAIETRKQAGKISVVKTSTLPKDFLKMVAEVFTANFSELLEQLAKEGHHPHFTASGKIFPDEVLLSVSLGFEGKLVASTLHASVDFDPAASLPSVQDLLNLAVDGIGHFYNLISEPLDILEDKKTGAKNLLPWTSQTLTELENIPFQWTELELDNRKVWIMMDKSNPVLDQSAEEWLKANDPNYIATIEEEERATESLFVTGAKAKYTAH